MTNARFWIFWNNSFVKLTLAPGQVIHVAAGGATDEGWRRECQRYEHCGDHIASEYSEMGADCDGRHDWHCETQCTLDRLAARECDDTISGRFMVPDWQRVRASQRDYTAEAMNY